MISKKIRKTILLVLIFCLSVILFSGCAQKEVEQPGIKIPVKKAETKDVSLNEILQETSITLNTTWTPYTLDDFLVYLGAKKRKPVEDETEKGGPVSVRLVYPSRLSIIDRPISFIATANSEKGNVDRVEFYLDGEKVAELSSPPYSFEFNPENYAKSEHQIKVVAYSGNYKDEDEIKFYNVIKGSMVIYPWKVNGGNIPYGYVNNFYQPDGSSIEVAMFTAYQPSYFYVDFKRYLKPGYNYLMATVNLDGVIVADQNPELLYVRFYNYGEKKYDRSYLYEWEAAQHPSEGPEKTGESYSLEPEKDTVQYYGKLIGRVFPFYGFDPFTKEFRLRIEGTGPTKFYVKPIVLEYYAVMDKKAPTVKYRRVYSNDSTVTCEFYVSEPVLATLYAYDASGAVRSVSEPKFEGWVEIEIPDRNTSSVSLKVVDGAGYVKSLPKVRVKR